MLTDVQGKIYKSTNGDVFEGFVIVDFNDTDYILDITNITQPKSYPLKDVEYIGNCWDFIEKYHPDYYHEDEIAWYDDLECLLKNECDEEKEARLKADWGNDPKDWRIAQDNIYQNILESAIKNYKSKIQQER